MPEIVYTKAIKCQYAEYTINHCEIIISDVSIDPQQRATAAIFRPPATGSA